MPPCPKCGTEVAEHDAACPRCGAMTKQVEAVSRVQARGGALSLAAHVVAFMACAALVAAPFLPWTKEGGGGDWTGIEWTGYDALILLGLGVVGIAVWVASLADRGTRVPWELLAVGAVALGLSTEYYLTLRSEVGTRPDYLPPVGADLGLYISVVAGAVAVAAAGVAIQRALAKRGGRRVL